MSDPRTPLEEDIDLGEIEEVEGNEAEDAEGDAPDAEDDGDAAETQEAEGEERDVAERRPSRSQTRVSNLTRQLGEERTARERLEREFAELRARSLQPPVDTAAQARAAAEEAERVRQMMPEEQIAYFRNRDRQEFGAALQNIEFRMMDRADKTAWQASCERNQQRARLADRVEQVLQDYRARGQNAEREQVYKFVLGDELDRKASGQLPRQRAAAARRVAAQTTRPSSARGDVSRSRTQKTQYDIDKEMLTGVTLGDL